METLEYLRQQNSQVSIILLFDKHAEQMRAVELLETDETKDEFNPRIINFLKESPKVVADYCENLGHGKVWLTFWVHLHFRYIIKYIIDTFTADYWVLY